MRSARHVGPGEERHVVDAAHGRHDLGPVGPGRHGSPLALEGPHRGVVVDSHDEDVALASRRLEVPDVAHVQEVEATVGERDPPPGRPRLGDEPFQPVDRDDLSHRYPRSSRTAPRSSSAVTVAVPRFITTRPPA